jgi:hypothetical protein
MNRSSAVAACFLAFSLITSFSSCDYRKVKIMDGQSPVRVMGGSITVHSDSGWKSDDGNKTFHTVNSYQLWTFTPNDQCSSSVAFSYKEPWTMTVYARLEKDSGAVDVDHSQNGIVITGNGKAMQTILIGSYGQGGFRPADGPDESKPSAPTVKRYAGVDDSNKDCDPRTMYCEYIKTITVGPTGGLVTQTLTSKRSTCRIDISGK